MDDLDMLLGVWRMGGVGDLARRRTLGARLRAHVLAAAVTNADLLRSVVDAGFYMTLATADEQGNPWASPVWCATADYIDRCLALFSTVSCRQGLAGLTRAEVEAPARLRLYRATATAHFVLSASDQRLPVDLS